MKVYCPRCSKELSSRRSMGGHVRYCPVSEEELFWMKVKKRGVHECWEWIAAKNDDGYGNLQEGGKYLHAHRRSYELTSGEIPNGMHVLHTCDNPGCVNPGHLWLGTHKDNMADRANKGRGYNGGNKPRGKTA